MILQLYQIIRFLNPFLSYHHHVAEIQLDHSFAHVVEVQVLKTLLSLIRPIPVFVTVHRLGKQFINFKDFLDGWTKVDLFDDGLPPLQLTDFFVKITCLHFYFSTQFVLFLQVMEQILDVPLLDLGAQS